MSPFTPSWLLAGLLVLSLTAAPAHAQLARTFVSAVNGNDANDCSQAAPCRTFQGAHDKTFDQGEVTVLTPGGYGALTITKSISIVNDGVGEAGMLVSGGVTGITINGGPGAYVNLRGITIQGIGFGGGTGLRFNTGFALTMTNCVVRNHTQDGIVFAPNAASNLAISDTLVADNGGNGILIQPITTTMNVRFNAVLNRVEAYQNSGSGIVADASSAPGNFAVVGVAVLASASGNNGGNGFLARSASGGGEANMHVVGSLSVNNHGLGLDARTAVGGGIVVGQSTLFGNVTGSAAGNVFSYGDNYNLGGSLPFQFSKN